MRDWTVYMRRDGKTERTVSIRYVGHSIEVYDAHGSDFYKFTDVMPVTREMFADFSHRTAHA